MPNRTSVVLASACLMLCVSSADARRNKGKSSCDDCCNVTCTSCSSIYWDCGTPCGSCCGTGECGCLCGCGGCGMLGGCGCGVLHETIIEGSIIEGSIIESDGDSEPSEAKDDEESPFISSTGVRISTTAIVRASRPLGNGSTNGLISLSVGSGAAAQAPTHQQIRIAEGFYGEAVRSYWRGDLATARQMAADGLSVNDQDARLWYFKALAEIGLSLEADAVQSLGAAAQVESQHPEQARQINRALERIQGHLRVKIQRARSAVRQPQPDRVADAVQHSKFANR